MLIRIRRWTSWQQSMSCLSVERERIERLHWSRDPLVVRRKSLPIGISRLEAEEDADVRKIRAHTSGYEVCAI